MITIQLAKENHIAAYTNLLQQTYEATYTNVPLGLTKECFSKEIFDSSDTQKYLLSNLTVTNKQRTWLTFDNKILVGSITIIEKESEYELRGFYVIPSYQGRGIGKKLWRKVFTFAKGKDITLDTYAHNEKTIEIYKKWGFVIDEEKGSFYRHWPEWPEGLQAKCIYMKYQMI